MCWELLVCLSVLRMRDVVLYEMRVQFPSLIFLPLEEPHLLSEKYRRL